METSVAGPARFFNGLSATPHAVTLRLGPTLEVAGPGVFRDWSLFDLRADDARSPVMRVGPAGSGERVECADSALVAALERRCPDLHRVEAGRGGLGRLVAWSIAAGVSILLAAVLGVPVAAGLLAPLVPSSVEARLGEAVEGQVDRLLGNPPHCAAPAGRAALDRLVARLSAGMPFRDGPRVSVRRHALANAFALPGGRVVVLSDIIAKARTPDEFAAILAHEFGHVAMRDPTRSVIAAGGSSFLLGLILGDLTGSTVLVTLSQAVVSAGYSREAERAADIFGVGLLGRIGADPTALATILERIDGEANDAGGAFAFLRSHPHTRERAAAIRDLAHRSGTDQPILSPTDWQALRTICHGDADRQTPPTEREGPPGERRG